MKAVFINPNWRRLKAHFRGNINPTQPLDLAYAAGAARKKHNVSICDLNALDAGFEAIPKADAYVITTAPGYVFWRCAPLGEEVPLEVAEYLRANYPDCKIIIIGPHGTLNPQRFLESRLADVVVRGECDLVVARVLDNLKRLERSGIAGISYLSKGGISDAEGLNAIANLDDLPVPAYDLLPMDRYHGLNVPLEKQVPAALYEASRGCIFKCVYCFKTLFRDAYRRKSPKRVGAELRMLKEKFGIGYAYFIDENFGIDDKWLEDVCKEIGKTGVKWGCETHFQVMTAHKLDLMAQAGCVEAEYGLESASPQVLQRLNKHIDLRHAAELIRHCIAIGIRPWLFLLAGSPGETRETLDETIGFVRQFPRKKIAFSVDTPLPYPTTALWQEGREEGRIKSDSWDELNGVSGTIGNKFTKEEAEFEKQRLSTELDRLVKVLVLEPFGEGGIGQYAYGMANALADYANITLATEREYELEKLPRKFSMLKLRLFPDSGMPFASMIKLLKYIRNNNLDIIDLQWEPHGRFQNLFLRLASMKGAKLVYTAHNVMPHENGAMDRARLAFLYGRADRILVHSEDSKRRLLAAFDIDAGKVRVISHGNCLAFLSGVDQKKARMKLGLSDGKIVLFTGFIREYKGLGILIEAFRTVKKKVKDAKLVIAGKPLIDVSEYVKAIRDCHLEKDVVTRFEYVPAGEMGLYFSAADVVALPYRNVYQSGVVQPAYAFGKPVVATAVGGLPEAVEDGKSGLLVPPDNPGELARALIKLLGNEALRKSMGARGKELAETCYSWNAIADSIMKIYRELL
jgi:D-inositol-3-phosphate glycosyltransferase